MIITEKDYEIHALIPYNKPKITAMITINNKQAKHPFSPFISSNIALVPMLNNINMAKRQINISIERITYITKILGYQNRII